MQTNLTWKKGLLSSLYQIYENGIRIGYLKDKTISQSSIGLIDDKEYLFHTRGFLNQHTLIFDNYENKLIGEIRYNNWMNKATITINDKTVYWKYDNLFNTKWSLFDSEEVNIRYSGSSLSGHINSNTNNSLLLLCGLFVTNYYWQLTIAIVITTLIPVWMLILN